MNKILFNSSNYKLKLYQQIMLLVFCLTIIVVSLNMFFIDKHMDVYVNHQLEDNADMAANAIATAPSIKLALRKTPVDEAMIADTVKGISRAIKASIIVLDKKQNIVSIYNPTNESLLNDDVTQKGNLIALDNLPVNIFKSQNAKTIVDNDNKPLGYVLVGYQTASGRALSASMFNLLVVAGSIGLALGLLGAWLLAYGIKKTLFGHEPIEIAHIMEERNILLDTINEGIFVTDTKLMVRIINSQGQALLKKAGLDTQLPVLNQPFATLGEVDALKDVLHSGVALKGVALSLSGLPTLGDVIPLKNNGKLDGILVSLREKGSVQEMAEQLSGVTNYADALRAKTHEFMNKMHVINGLIYTKNYDELKKYIADITEDDANEVQDITARIKDPLLASFLIAKKSRSHELLVDFALSEESSFPAELSKKINMNSLIIIIGNLLENSFDVLKKKENDRSVLLEILTYENELVIMVSNNGEAIPQTELAKIFQKGYTTKGKGHGYGLALLKEHVDDLHGTISVDSDELNGTEFTVEIPLQGECKND